MWFSAFSAPPAVNLMETIIRYLRERRRQHRDELFEMLRIPSVSTLPEHAGDVRRCAEFVANHLREIGLKTVEIMPTAGHPVVYAEWRERAAAPTILIYGHYDVQPPDPLDLWVTPPFAPTIRDGDIYARGASDDKGQFWAYVAAIEAFLAMDGALPVNVKLLIEGEEEIGSGHLHEFIGAHADLLKADAMLLSDNSQFQRGVPTICCGTRGLAHGEIHVKTADIDSHSGAFGGVAENPILVLAKLLAKLKDEQNRVTIPGFYDDVAALSEEERRNIASLPFDEAGLKREIGLRELVGEAGFSPIERKWARPTLEVNGIVGGFTGEGVKTIIPAKAMAKITMRLVPRQAPERIFNAAKAYIEGLAPSSAAVEFTGGPDGRAYLTPLDHPILAHVSRALRAVYQRDPVFIRTGGTISVLSTFADTMGFPIVMIGLGNPDDNAHAPNERLTEELFYLGIETAATVLHELKEWRPE